MKELLEKYPKAAKIVKDYYLEKMIESLNDRNLPKDFKDHVREQGIQDDMIVKVMEEGARNLFDVFDLNELYITTFIDRKDEAPDKIYFKCSISGKSGTIDTFRGLFKTRKEAEKEAVMRTFKLLEEKI